jgi:hypothetical protein
VRSILEKLWMQWSSTKNFNKRSVENQQADKSDQIAEANLRNNSSNEAEIYKRSDQMANRLRFRRDEFSIDEPFADDSSGFM